MTSTISSRRRRSRYGNQSFRKLVKKFNDVGLPFTDDQFRSADASVYHSTQYRHRLDVGKIAWKRPKELYNSTDPNESTTKESTTVTLLPKSSWSWEDFPSLFCYDGPNQWFIAAGLAIASHRSLLNQLINLDEDHFRRTGIVKFNIWQFGTWHKVVVDDKLPVDVEHLVFTRPFGGNASNKAFWLPLLEKAYAKLCGSYESLATNGSLASTLIDFTGGGVVHTVNLGTATGSQVEVIARELTAKSLILLKTKDFKSGSFGLIGNRYYLVKQIKKHGSSPGGTLRRLTSTLTSKSSLSATPDPSSPSSPSSSHHQPSIQLLSTIYEPPRGSSSGPSSPANSSFHSFSGPKLLELMIPSSEITKHFDSLTVCRPYQYAKDRIHRLFLSTIQGLQLCFDVHSSSVATTSEGSPSADVSLCIAQKSVSNPVALGFRIHSVELNRRYKVHQFDQIKLAASFDPVASRNHVQLIRLPVGRYLLTPICSSTANELPVMISICGGGDSGATVDNLFQLSQDMPRYQLVSFMSPKYPVCVSRLVVHGVDGLEKQDRFGSANPYCIIRHSGKVIKSYCLSETLNPKWSNLSTVFYHKKMNIPIQVEIWHRTLLVDYFIGMVQLMPVIMSEDDRTEEDDSKVQNGDPKDKKSNNKIQSQQLTDKKGVNQRAGTLNYELYTYENLKHF